jgi:hypothetical protein
LDPFNSLVTGGIITVVIILLLCCCCCWWWHCRLNNGETKIESCPIHCKK